MMEMTPDQIILNAIMRHWKDFWYAISQKIGGCLRCGSIFRVKPESSHTMYHWDGQGLDPNRDVRLCRPCAKEHHGYWAERWAEYHAEML